MRIILVGVLVGLAQIQLNVEGTTTVIVERGKNLCMYGDLYVPSC